MIRKKNDVATVSDHESGVFQYIIIVPLKDKLKLNPLYYSLDLSVAL